MNVMFESSEHDFILCVLMLQCIAVWKELNKLKDIEQADANKITVKAF